MVKPLNYAHTLTQNRYNTAMSNVNVTLTADQVTRLARLTSFVRLPALWDIENHEGREEDCAALNALAHALKDAVPHNCGVEGCRSAHSIGCARPAYLDW